MQFNRKQLSALLNRVGVHTRGEDSTWWKSLVPVIVGALISAVPTWLLANRQSEFQHRESMVERRISALRELSRIAFVEGGTVVTAVAGLDLPMSELPDEALQNVNDSINQLATVRNQIDSVITKANSWFDAEKEVLLVLYPRARIPKLAPSFRVLPYSTFPEISKTMPDIQKRYLYHLQVAYLKSVWRALRSMEQIVMDAPKVLHGFRDNLEDQQQ